MESLLIQSGTTCKSNSSITHHTDDSESSAVILFDDNSVILTILKCPVEHCPSSYSLQM